MNLRKERIGEAQVADALCAVPVAAAVTSMMIIAIKRRGKNNGDGSAGTVLWDNVNRHEAAPTNAKS